jgi:hypothetical protein
MCIIITAVYRAAARRTGRIDGLRRFASPPRGALMQGEHEIEIWPILELVRRTTVTKHLLSGVAVAAALVLAAPAWAQNPSGGNAVGLPGPNPGGPGLTPYTGGGAPPPAAAPAAPPGMPPAAAAEPATSAAPPMHHHHHHYVHARRGHGRRMRHVAGTSQEASTAELNRQELARIQAGSAGGPMGPGPGAPPPEAGGGPPPGAGEMPPGAPPPPR